MWDRLKSKSRFIGQLFKRNFNLRRLEEDSSEDPSFNAAQITALATGDDRIMVYVDLEAELQLNKNLLAGYRKEIDSIKVYRCLTSRDTNIPYLEKQLEHEQSENQSLLQDSHIAAENIPTCTGANFTIQIGDVACCKKPEAAKVLHDIADELSLELVDGKTLASKTVGAYGGFELQLEVEPKERWLVMIGARPQCIHYDCRLLTNLYTACDRLEKRLQKMVQDSERALRHIETIEQRLTQSRKALTELENKAADLAQLVVKQESDKKALEQELGLCEENDAAVIEVDC